MNCQYAAPDDRVIPAAVHEACRQFADGQYRWHGLLVRHLYAFGLNVAFQWLKSCVAALLPAQESENEAQLRNDLEVIDSFAASGPSLQEIGQRVHEIWYRPNRDAAQTAMSHLYARIAARDPAAKPVVAYAAPVSVMVDSSPDRESAFRIAIDEFLRLTEKL